jgi:uncharacterized protein YecE (DUF72 family)
MIFLGCSGWSYKDWEGNFYPDGKHDKLSYYANMFGSVEINSTFYMIPSERLVSSWVQKVRNIQGFKFSVKLPRDLSHDTLLHNGQAAGHFAQSFEASILAILRKSDLIGSVLLQLPPFFGTKHIENLLTFLSMIDSSKYRYAVEVRNNSLYNNMDLANKLSEHSVSIVQVDSPEKHISAITSGTNWAYVRLHGQNAQEWSNPNSHGMDRYLYSYSEAELKMIAGKIMDAASRYADLYVYFNNHPQGNAPRNASSIASMLGMPVPNRNRALSEY